MYKTRVNNVDKLNQRLVEVWSNRLQQNVTAREPRKRQQAYVRRIGGGTLRTSGVDTWITEQTELFT